MISFKFFLTEARMASLYHGTRDIANLPSILKYGITPATYHAKFELLTYKTNQDKYDIQSGVSLSRSKDYAYHYSKYRVVLELDQQKLTQKYKVVPIQYWQGSKQPARIKAEAGIRWSQDMKQNEFEEFVITKKPIPSEYITRIWISPMLNDKETEEIEKIRQQYGSSFIKVLH